MDEFIWMVSPCLTALDVIVSKFNSVNMHINYLMMQQVLFDIYAKMYTDIKLG